MKQVRVINEVAGNNAEDRTNSALRDIAEQNGTVDDIIYSPVGVGSHIGFNCILIIYTVDEERNA